VIPIQDALPPRSTPWITWIVASINVVVFFSGWFRGPDAQAALLVDHALTPVAFSWLNAITSVFLHNGLTHLAINTVALVVCGENVEDRFGHLAFACLYLGCGMLSVTVAAWAVPASAGLLLGTGGALGAVLGAHLAMYPHGRVLAFPLIMIDLIEVPSGLLIAIWFLLQVLGGLSMAGGLIDTGLTAVMWIPLAGLVIGGIGGGLVRFIENRGIGRSGSRRTGERIIAE
jgi:membrane associated rhomboid family serine protease